MLPTNPTCNNFWPQDFGWLVYVLCLFIILRVQSKERNWYTALQACGFTPPDTSGDYSVVGNSNLQYGRVLCPKGTVALNRTAVGPGCRHEQ